MLIETKRPPGRPRIIRHGYRLTVMIERDDYEALKRIAAKMGLRVSGRLTGVSELVRRLIRQAVDSESASADPPSDAR